MSFSFRGEGGRIPSGVSRESASQWVREQEELSRTVINSSIRRQAIEYVMARAKINVLD